MTPLRRRNRCPKKRLSMRSQQLHGCFQKLHPRGIISTIKSSSCPRTPLVCMGAVSDKFLPARGANTLAQESSQTTSVCGFSQDTSQKLASIWGFQAIIFLASNLAASAAAFVNVGRWRCASVKDKSLVVYLKDVLVWRCLGLVKVNTADVICYSRRFQWIYVQKERKRIDFRPFQVSNHGIRNVYASYDICSSFSSLFGTGTVTFSDKWFEIFFSSLEPQNEQPGR